MPIKSIDNFIVTEFGMYLKTEKGCNFNTTNKFLQNLKRITYRCLSHGCVLKDPFAGISLTMKEVERPYLTEDELKSIMEYNSSFERLTRVRDFFMFSCFTGLAYADVEKSNALKSKGMKQAIGSKPKGKKQVDVQTCLYWMCR